MGIDRLYHDKQLSILKRALREDWYMMINHGAVRAGKTQLDNDLFL
ncbi:TPA: PBSX family phage terminase large subunit, partial [Streptococcus suis]|nr:PBSX family phage terminase large subunit [Streptococcus suis]